MAQDDANAKHGQMLNALKGIGGSDEGGGGGDTSTPDAENKTNKDNM